MILWRERCEWPNIDTLSLTKVYPWFIFPQFSPSVFIPFQGCIQDLMLHLVVVSPQAVLAVSISQTFLTLEHINFKSSFIFGRLLIPLAEQNPTKWVHITLQISCKKIIAWLWAPWGWVWLLVVNPQPQKLALVPFLAQTGAQYMM